MYILHYVVFIHVLYSGLPVLLSVLKEERDDVELIRGSLETLVSALTTLDASQRQNNEVQPASMNSDLFSREPESISVLLSLLVYTMHILFFSNFLLPVS